MTPKTRTPALRFVLATPICDGHDAAISAITRMLRAKGAEAIYIGFNKTPYQIAKAALEEDAHGIALSTYNGGHMTFIRELLKEQKTQGIPDTPLFCGGGGTILAREVAPLEKMGVAGIYRPPMPLEEAVDDMIARAAAKAKARATSRAKSAIDRASSAASKIRTKSGAKRGGATGKRVGEKAGSGDGFPALARRLSDLERKPASAGRAKDSKVSVNGARAKGLAPVWGIGGRGGSGKSTIVDELVLRFLKNCRGNVAILSVDPTLGDRLRMLHCYSPRVFMRSLRMGPEDSPKKVLPGLIDALRRGPFELVIVESVGLGQIDVGVAPFVDHSIYAMTPEYGTDVQLDKEVLLHRAEVVVMNKCDYIQATARARRVRNYLGEGQIFIETQAKHHQDEGVTRLFEVIAQTSGLKLKPTAESPNGHVEGTPIPDSRRGYLGGIVEAHEAYYKEMRREIDKAAKDPKIDKAYRRRFSKLWKTHGFEGPLDERKPLPKGESIEGDVLLREDEKGRKIPVAKRTTCDLWVPTLGLPPERTSTPEIIAYFYKQNVPGDFPFTEGAFNFRRTDEDPIRMFAGLGLSETTNERFHLLSKRADIPRLSTAFDSLTLYGVDSDEAGALAKVGEGGVAVDTIEDMERLYAGFDLEQGSVSLTMSGPAPTILAMFLAAAKRRGFSWKKMRGTIQTDILKEIHAQNESVFPLDPSLRLISDMMEFTIKQVPNWYPISISGYHIGEKGANPIQELAFTLANGFSYVEVLKNRGLKAEEFLSRFSFFFTTGSELEFNVLGRVARRIWSVAMKRYYGVEGAGQRLKFHSQTSGRSLQDIEPLHNLARVTLQAEHALHNNTNSLHTNSYKETYTTPEQDDVMLAMGCQQIPLLESGDFQFTENLNQGGYGLSYLEDEVERAVFRIFREIDHQGGVIPAIENEYFRTVIQEEVQRELKARRDGERVMVGVNYLNFGEGDRPRGELVNIPLSEKRLQVARTKAFKKAHRKEARAALERLKEVARTDGNVFAELVHAVEVATVGQVTHALWEVWGRFRASM